MLMLAGGGGGRGGGGGGGGGGGPMSISAISSRMRVVLVRLGQRTWNSVFTASVFAAAAAAAAAAALPWHTHTHTQDLPPLRLPAISSRKRVVLVRHGQSTWNAEGRIQGSSDFSELTNKGIAQAETTRDMVGGSSLLWGWGTGWGLHNLSSSGSSSSSWWWGWAEGRIQGSSEFTELTNKGIAQAETTRDMGGLQATCKQQGGGGRTT